MAPEQRPVVAASTVAPAAVAESPRNELQLVSAVLRKDRKAAARFVSLYADAVYGYVRHRLAPRADRVEDVVQDVFLAALASLAGFRGTSSLRSWLLGIARHKVEDYYREQLRDPEPLEEAERTEVAAVGAPIDETIDRQRMEARTECVLQQLPDSYRVALLWRYWESRSVREIAVATGKTEKSVERLLARARVRFRELWEQT
jgi:RNA polymerase sigma-70 factor (ECF subfamily)